MFRQYKDNSTLFCENSQKVEKKSARQEVFRLAKEIKQDLCQEVDERFGKIFGIPFGVYDEITNSHDWGYDIRLRHITFEQLKALTAILSSAGLKVEYYNFPTRTADTYCVSRGIQIFNSITDFLAALNKLDKIALNEISSTFETMRNSGSPIYNCSKDSNVRKRMFDNVQQERESLDKLDKDLDPSEVQYQTISVKM